MRGAALLLLFLTRPVFADGPGWLFSDPEAFRVAGAGEVELYRESSYRPVFRSPLAIALIADVAVDDFVLDLELAQTGREYDHRDLCLFFGFQDPSHFYYVHLATKPDPHAHNIFIVNGEARRALAPEPARGVEWGTGTWHRVRLERRGDRIDVSFDGEGILSASDPTFGRGRIGVGSFDDTGKFRNLELAAARLHPASGDPFEDSARELPVHLERRSQDVEVRVGDRLFTRYLFEGQPKPILYPVLAASGERINRAWPLEEIDGESRDHPHHRSLWFAHGDVNGVDFWTEGPDRGRIVHEAFLESAPDTIATRNRWVAPDGEIIATDERRIHFGAVGDLRTIDYDVTVIASHGEITFGDTKEGTFAIRVRPELRANMVNQQGERGRGIWGHRSEWVDYHGEVDGRTLGVAIFDHPANPRHPTWWHARDYGLFAANPFGAHDFEGTAPGTGALVVPTGGRVRFRYRVVIHPGAAHDLDARYRAFLRTP